MNKEKNAEINDEKSAEMNEETNDDVLLFNLALTTRTWKLRWRTSTLTSPGLSTPSGASCASIMCEHHV
jgi:hypothetical protein